MDCFLGGLCWVYGVGWINLVDSSLWVVLGGLFSVGYLGRLFWMDYFVWVIVGGFSLGGRFVFWLGCLFSFVWTYTAECIQARGGSPQTHVDIHKLAWTFHKLAGNLHKLPWKCTKFVDCTGSTCPPRGN